MRGSDRLPAREVRAVNLQGCRKPGVTQRRRLEITAHGLGAAETELFVADERLGGELSAQANGEARSEEERAIMRSIPTQIEVVRARTTALVAKFAGREERRIL